jgi:hypothetical protein
MPARVWLRVFFHHKELQMEVKSLLAKAAECKTEADAEKLLEALMEAFSDEPSVSHLPQFNSESYMEDGKPFVRFELNKEISEHYITMIRPEIRDGKLVVDVVTNHMLDGMGLASCSWEAEEGMEDAIEADDDRPCHPGTGDWYPPTRWRRSR